jgi:hypothetical protein
MEASLPVEYVGNFPSRDWTRIAKYSGWMGLREAIYEILSRIVGITGSNLFHPSRGPLAAILPLFPRRLQLPIPLGVNLPLMPGEHVLRRDVANGAVQANVVVMLYVTLHQTPRIFDATAASRDGCTPL